MSEYEVQNWDNWERPLTHDELHEVEQRAAGLHFTKESFSDDAIALQALYLTEALLRHIRYLPIDDAE